MVQEMLDNFSETKKMVGKFIVTQLKELFTIESALRVLGDAFIKDNFTVPVNIILERGLEKIKDNKENEVTETERATMLQYPTMASNQPIVDENNNLVTAVDFDTAIKTISDILNNAELNKYDVAIGEGPYQDTIKMANFMDLKDLATQGIPIPPNTLIEMSMIPQGEKKKILMQLQQQALMVQKQQQQQQVRESQEEMK